MGADFAISLSVCASVSPQAYVWNRWSDFHKICVQSPCDRGLVLLWWRCDMLCTCGLMDDVTFGRSGPYGDAWLAALRYRGGVWWLWMPCLVLSQSTRVTDRRTDGHNNYDSQDRASIAASRGKKRLCPHCERLLALMWCACWTNCGVCVWRLYRWSCWLVHSISWV